MAAFSFPQNPTDGQKVTNADTGVTYVYQTIPGKWDVQVKDFAGEFVDTTGDTMTGPLKIFTDEVNTSGNLCLKSTSLVTKNLNHLIYCESTNGSPMFGITNDGFVTTHHNLQCTSSTAFFTSGGSPNNTPGYCAFSILGPAVGDTTNVPYPNRLSPILRTWYNFDGTGTEVRYFGMIDDNNAIVNKAYVDTALDAAVLKTGSTMTGPLIINDTNSDPLNINSGKFIVGANGDTSVNNLNVSTALDNKGKISFSSTGPQYIDIYGSNLKSLFIRAGNNTTDSGILNILSINSSRVNIVSNVTKDRGGTGSKDFVIQGTTASDPSNTTGELFYVFRNTPIGGGVGDAVNYFGYTGGGNNIQTKTSVQALLDDAIPSSIPTDFNFDNLTVTTKLAGATGNAGGTLQVYANSVDINAGGRLTLPNYINASTAPTPTIQLLNGSDALVFRSDIQVGLTNTTGRIGYLAQSGLAMYKPYFVFGGGVAGSDNPDTAGADNQISFNNVTSEYAIFQSKGYSQNGYQFFADTSSGTPVKVMNWLLSADGTKGYINCYFKPQSANSLVRLSDLSTGVVGSINTYSVSNGEEGSDEAQYTVSNHSIPGQCEFDGRLTTGRGFTLQGCTADQPTNTSAVCIQLYHPITAAAQFLYKGDTTGDDTCVQTKASTLSLVRGTANTFTAANKFHNTVEIGTSSTGHLVDVFNVIRVRANSNNGLSGFNNGAVYVNDKSGATVAGLYDQGLYSTKKLIFNSNSSTQDIYLQGANRKGLNIKYDDSGSQVVLATFDPDGSVLKSTLDLNLNKLLNIATPTNGFDGANKTYVDSKTSSLQSAIHTAVNGSTDYASLKAALLAALA